MMEVQEHGSAVAMPPPASTTAPAVELRILSGFHQGARLTVDAGGSLRIGSTGECDVLLGDYGAAPPVRLHLQHDGWTVGDENDAALQIQAFGAMAMLGEVGVTVCTVDAPWQAFEPPLPTALAAQPAAAREDEPQVVQELPDAQEDALVEMQVLEADVRSFAPLRPERPVRRRRQRALHAGVALGLFGACWMLWGRLPPPAPTETVNGTPAKKALSPQARDDAVKQAILAIALVDPALRMAVTPNAEGGVTVSGWVDSVDQFDSLAQALSGLRPLPRLAVHTASEMLDVLQDAASAHGAHLKFTPMGSGKVQVTGLVATPAEQNTVLAQLRARAPEGIEIVDGLRVASMQGPEVRRWLEAQGLGVTQVEWDGAQLLVDVDVNTAQRTRLERLLAAAQTPLTGVPFVLQTRMLKEIAAPTAMASARASAGDSGLPFRIRSVVGGPAPYVVLADGSKLQPGGARSGWQLVSVAQDHIVWNGPKRLEVSR